MNREYILLGLLESIESSKSDSVIYYGDNNRAILLLKAMLLSEESIEKKLALEDIFEVLHNDKNHPLKEYVEALDGIQNLMNNKNLKNIKSKDFKLETLNQHGYTIMATSTYYTFENDVIPNINFNIKEIKSTVLVIESKNIKSYFKLFEKDNHYLRLIRTECENESYHFDYEFTNLNFFKNYIENIEDYHKLTNELLEIIYN